EGRGVQLHSKKTIVCTQFWTRAERILYRVWGCNVMNVGAAPEVKLAREAEATYVCINFSGTDVSTQIRSDRQGDRHSSIVHRSGSSNEEDWQQLAYVLPAKGSFLASCRG
ncbi:hypothetical protein PUNSTDRAFT_76543, partial [Punctularia strigosozonata HHB-11173 SS5]